ncbi:MAG: NIPSNAP family protein [Caldilineaceae bacterium]
MITVIRTYTIQPGTRTEAFAHVAKQAAYIPGKYGGSNTSVLRNVAGPSNQVHSISNWESLAAWEEGQKKIAQDAEIQEIVAQGQGMFSSVNTAV